MEAVYEYLMFPMTQPISYIFPIHSHSLQLDNRSIREITLANVS